MQESAMMLLLIYILLEIFEIFWQRGENFREYIENLFQFYKKGVILFILLHPTLYFVIFSQMALQNYSFLASLLVLIKVFDIGFKISIMDKIYHNKDLGVFKLMIEGNFPLSVAVKGSGLVIYSAIFFFAFS